MSNLPHGWAKSTLGEVGEYLNGRGFKKSEWRDSGRPIIRIQNLTGTSGHFNHFAGQPDERYLARSGDILVSWAATLGVFVWNGPEAVVNQHIFKVRTHLDRRFHRYLLLSVLDDLRRQTHGSGMVHITKSRFENTSVFLPPLAEQERIVAAIEEQFSRLDAGVAGLERVQQNLERMRVAILEEAVSGQLTSPDCDRSPGELPDGWRACTPRELAENCKNALAIGPFGSNLKVVDYTSDGVPLVFVRQVRSGAFGGPGTRFISKAKANELSAHRVTGGDVLITKMGEPPGDAAVYPIGHPDAVITADVIKLSPGPDVLPEYLELAIGSRQIRVQFVSITSGVAQQKVSLARFRKSILVPVPPLLEQRRIVATVRERMQELSRLETIASETLVRAVSLRSSMFDAAFSGKLVPQDPDDEPASVLLDRIVAERSSSNGQKSTKTGRRGRRKLTV
jgi:type I restriction enzyme S subunit